MSLTRLKANSTARCCRCREYKAVKIVGCDPGINGALALLVINDGAAPQLIDAIDVPTVGDKSKRRVDAIAICKWIENHRPDFAGIERGQSMPLQGSSSTFLYGRACGSLETVLCLCEIPLVIVEPAVWKRHRGLHGKDKKAPDKRLCNYFRPHIRCLL
jgi:hypothetical protein